MVDWIISNKEWFLSGLGILIITSIGGVIKFLGKIEILVMVMEELIRDKKGEKDLQIFK